MNEAGTPQLERSTPVASLPSPAEGLASAPDYRGPGGQRVCSQPVARVGSQRRLAGLTPSATPGVPRRLAPEQLARLLNLLHPGPAAYGFRGQLWTRKRLAEVSWVRFGLLSDLAHVGQLRKAIRWSPQKLMRRARRRDEVAIAHWHPETWLALKKGRKYNNRQSSSEMNWASILRTCVVSTCLLPWGTDRQPTMSGS